MLVYHVDEYPQVSEVRVEGMMAFSPTEQRVTSAITVLRGDLLNSNREKETINNLEQLYKSNGYINAVVSEKVILEPLNCAVVVFVVTERPLPRNRDLLWTERF